MKKAFSLGLVLLVASLSLAACRLNRTGTGLQPDAPGSTNNPQPALPAGSGAPLDQADQSLNDLQATLQAMDTDLNAVDPGPVIQSLDDLQGALQVTPVPTATPDTSLDQTLDSLLQSVLSEPAP
jgi:hypothetical protein